jgi:cytidine deaminase
MKKLLLQIPYLEYETPGDLPDPERALLQSAKQALSLSYAPYSHFHVGAAALLANGQTVPGANYENASYPLCLCAERSAVAAAVSQYPNTPIVAMAITVDSNGPVADRPATPCGACRQVLAETERKNKQVIRLILQGQTGPVIVFSTSLDLLPLAFDGSFLKDIF